MYIYIYIYLFILQEFRPRSAAMTASAHRRVREPWVEEARFPLRFNSQRAQLFLTYSLSHSLSLSVSLCRIEICVCVCMCIYILWKYQHFSIHMYMYMYVCAYMHTWASIEGFCVEQYGSIRRATGPWCTCVTSRTSYRTCLACIG